MVEEFWQGLPLGWARFSRAAGGTVAPTSVAPEDVSVQYWNPMVPELLVADLRRSRTFYVSVLGFVVCFERTDPHFAYLALGRAQLMLAADHADAWRTGTVEAPRGRGISLQIECADARALRVAVLASGHALYRELTESVYITDDGDERQREFLVQDPDGYLLRFVQPLP